MADMVNSEKQFSAAVKKLLRCTENQPFDTAVIFGSGLGFPAGELETFHSFAYDELAVLPRTTVQGHEGRLDLCCLGGRRLLLFYGRHHLYEGLSAWEATVNVRLAGALGCRRLLITNAAGGINPTLKPGHLMFVSDHLNLMGDNPLRGRPGAFIDLARLYDRTLFPPLRHYAESHGISLREGVLAAVLGPSYETPAEIRMLASLGADAVCMSGVPEAIMAKYLGFEVAAFSFIANLAAGRGEGPLHHDEVLAQAFRKRDDFSCLVTRLLRQWCGLMD
ncbi:MAG: purine-nucleoside phosphorylase [Deltaproteobacteria bacterium]|nr:purine-nucleoside phosphorylase [Deltaproteobacteria bacterium]